MDHPQTITSIEWFFGYGGNHLGLRRILPGLRCIAACEIEAYALANIIAKVEGQGLDDFPIWSDAKTFPCEVFRGLVDIFVASYPCQGFSSAGKREGQKDPRFLWPWVLRAVAIIQPRVCFFENVDAHVSLGLSTVISDLEEAGYEVEEGVFSAVEVGAPQQRKRVFIVAYRKDIRHQQRRAELCRWFGLPASVLSRSSEKQERMGDDLREQIERHVAGRLFSHAARASQLANAAEGGCRVGPTAQSPRGEQSDADGCSALENPEGERSGEAGRFRCGESTERTSGAGEGVDQVNASGTQPHCAGQGNDGPGRETIRPREGCSGVGLADSIRERREGSELSGTHEAGPPAPRAIAECCHSWHWPGFVARPHEQQHEWEPLRLTIPMALLDLWNRIRANPPSTLRTQIAEREASTVFHETLRKVGVRVDGCSSELDNDSNTDELRLLGNGVYPATAAKAFLTLILKLV